MVYDNPKKKCCTSLSLSLGGLSIMSQSGRYIGNPLFDSLQLPTSSVSNGVSSNRETEAPEETVASDFYHQSDISATNRRQNFVYGSNFHDSSASVQTASRLRSVPENEFLLTMVPLNKRVNFYRYFWDLEF